MADAIKNLDTAVARVAAAAAARDAQVQAYADRLNGIATDMEAANSADGGQALGSGTGGSTTDL